MTKNDRVIPIEKLRRECGPELFDFKSTAELSPLDTVIGQDRAVQAVSFGIDIENEGYNIYALGPAGTGKTTTIRKFLETRAADEPVPDDWMYVNNFESEDKPRALHLPAGRGCELKRDMDRIVSELESEIPQVFESEEYQKEQEQIQEELQKRRQALLTELDTEARAKGFSLIQTSRGIMLAPVFQGNVITPDQFNQLSEEKRKDLQDRQQELQTDLREAMYRVEQLERQSKEQVNNLDQQIVSHTVDRLISEAKEKYAEFEAVTTFLDAVRQDILENVDIFKRVEQMERVQQQMPLLFAQGQPGVSFDKYRVNLIIDNCNRKGAPVIVEENPGFYELTGRIEHEARLGALVTDFTMIKAGSLHNANGGYLMIDARDVLTTPFAWDALKRALRTREAKIEMMGEAFRAIATRTLEPEPIPLDVKVILTGEPLIYYLLYSADPDFQELFRVKADFAIQMDRNDEAEHQYARFVATVCKEENLRHFDPTGVAQIVEYGSRMVEHQGKIAIKFGDVIDIIRQANYWAGKNGHDLVLGQDVDQAIDAMIYRSNRLEEQIRELIEEGTLLIDTEGASVGQVNGISVLALGDYAFGKPSRITARTYVGTKGVINIDRETELGGRIHNKGVLILAGYLGGKFASDTPLALSASLTFEQLYEEVEGDSASSAELYALLSSLADYPIQQNLAVTGSVNQWGHVQAIGGVNEKIEGFFRVCEAKGLTGDQGVIIPQSNVKHLMLRQEVIRAVQQGMFNIYAVSTVDEGIEILTGKPAGERMDDGTYPEGTVNWAVEKRLRELAAKVKAFAGREVEAARPEEEREREPVTARTRRSNGH